MRTIFYLMCCGAVIGLAYWAYKENYRTQNSIRRVSELQYRIAQERTSISVLRAEWAYLNRPGRLRELVQMNFGDLQLLPLLPENFADVEIVAYPKPGINLDEINTPVSVMATDEPQDEEYP